MDNFQRLGVAEDKVSEQEIAEDVLRFRCLKEKKKRIPVSALVYLLHKATILTVECSDFAACIHE